jgi:hypothetical protein
MATDLRTRPQVILAVIANSHDLQVNTSCIAPQTAKAKFRESVCNPENDLLKIHGKCARWLIKCDCLSLLRELFEKSSAWKIIIPIFSMGSIDVLRWLHEWMWRISSKYFYLNRRLIEGMKHSPFTIGGAKQLLRGDSFTYVQERLGVPH